MASCSYASGNKNGGARGYCFRTLKNHLCCYFAVFYSNEICETKRNIKHVLIE